MTALQLESALRRLDFMRRSSVSLGGQGCHKEWLHFCVLAGELKLLINFSVCDDVFPVVDTRAEIARLTLLVHDGMTWHGCVDTCDEASEIVGGQPEMHLGENYVRLGERGYEIVARSRDGEIEIELLLVPRVNPAIAPNIPLTQGPPLHWTVVPHLRAEGRVRIGGHERRVANAAAYHDHNWGEFAWGHDLSWEWGFAIPDDPSVPWTFACVRLSNRARTHTIAQGIFLWHGARHLRTYRDDDLRVESSPEFFAVSPPIFKVPPAMRLVWPEQRSDVPRRHRMRASVGDEWLEFEFEPSALAQVVIPTEVGLGVTVINEVHGGFHVRGRVAARPIDHHAEGFFEFLSA
ncbi:hypothetical protein ACNOYE_03840 [Nannocystaceae bacterium ST9]